MLSSLVRRLPFRGDRHRLLIAGVVAAALVGAATTLSVRLLTGGGAEATEPGAVLGPSLAYYSSPTPSPSPVPTATLEPPARGSQPTTIAIPRFGVEAPIVVLGVDSSGAMETPSGPWEAAWYDFTVPPGGGGNAVFSGHVDALFTGDPGPAVFFHLKDLEPGDRIEIRGSEGAVYRYAVVESWSVHEDTEDLSSIVGPTDTESITLITCGGAGGRQYDQRLVVRAERV